MAKESKEIKAKAKTVVCTVDEECTIVKGVDTFFKEKYLRTVA